MGKISDDIKRLFDYRGVNVNNVNKPTNISANSDYSPNNIRRVVISPDGVLIAFHRSLPNGKAGQGSPLFSYITFSAVALNREENELNYKPILLNLSEPRVCACVEEIIICTQSMNGVFDSYAYQREVSVEGMLKGFNNKQGSVDDVVKRRFQRLRYFSLCDCTLHEILTYCKDINFLKGFISEDNRFSNRIQKKEYQGADEYWKYANLQTGVYPFDAKVLADHFNKLKSIHEANEKRAKVDKFTDERNKSKLEGLSKDYASYCDSAEALIKFNKVIETCGSNGIIDFSYIQKPVISQLSYIKGMETMKGVDKRLVKNDNLDIKQAQARNEELCNIMKKTLAEYTANVLINGLAQVSENSVTLRTLVKELESSVIVPPEIKSVMDMLHSKTGFTFDGRNISTSYINSCWIFCMLFLDRSAEGYKAEWITRDFWEGVARK